VETKKNYKPNFSQFLKKQDRPFKAEILDQIEYICSNPKSGETKDGDLSGIRIHKFKFKKQQYLIAYYFEDNNETTEFLMIDFYQIGSHENFYRDLKSYLRSIRWYK
jgi:mRNA-degrading endonuclease RelE of RelBE toxin-antitoxin system